MHTPGKVSSGLSVRAGGGRIWLVLAICLMLPVLLSGPAPARAAWSVVEVGGGTLAAAGGDLVAWVGSDGLLHALRRTTGEEWTAAVPSESGGVAELAAGAAGVAFIGRNQYLYLWQPGRSVSQVDTHSAGKQRLAVVGNHILWLDRRDGYIEGEGGDWYNASVYHHDAGTGQTVRLAGPSADPAKNYPAGDLAVNGDTVVWARYGGGIWRTYRAELDALLSGGVAEEVYASTARLRAVPVGNYLAWAGAEGLVLYRNGETQPVPGTAGASRPAADGELLAFTRPVGGGLRLFVYDIVEGSPVEVAAAEDTIHCYGLRDGVLAWVARSGDANRTFVAVNGAADQEAPGMPGGLRAAEVAADRVVLAWERASDDLMVTGYAVYRDGVPVGHAGALATSFEDAGLEAGRTYNYIVRALDAAGHTSEPVTLEVTTAGARVRVLAPSPVAEGASFTVTVAAYHATDLYAADVSLAFDPEVLQVAALSIAPPLNELILRQSYDNQAGTAAWVAGRQGQVPGVSGDVPLAELTFSAVGVGSAVVAPAAASLADGLGRTIPVSCEGATVTVLGASGLAGTVEAQGLGVVAGITVRLYDAAGTLLAEVATDIAGRFAFADLPSGSYHLLASRPGCLTRYLGRFRLGVGERLEVPTVTLFNGDVDRDDRVDLSDLAALGLAYGTGVAEAGFNGEADFNADGVVDLLDFVLLARSYGLVGDTLP